MTDRGPQFSSQVWRAFFKLLGATASLSSGYHPQSNGQTERANQELEATLRSLAMDNPSTWCSQLPWAEYAHNTLQSSATKVSPFQCQFGFQPPLFPEQEEEVGVPSVSHFMRRCRRTWRKARQALLQTSKAAQVQANRRRRPAPGFLPGQRVWLSSGDLPLQVESRKLAPRYVGRVRGGVQYLVDWEGYGPEERSWVKAQNIFDKDFVQEYHRQHPDRPGNVRRRS